MIRIALQLNNHPLKKKNVFPSDEDVGATNVQKLSAEHQTLLKRDQNYLVHALKCKDCLCSEEGCFEMKQLILHAYECKIQGCRICKRTLILCYYHVWVCKHDSTCGVHFCSNLWQKIDLQLELLELIKAIEDSFGDFNNLEGKPQFLEIQPLM